MTTDALPMNARGTCTPIAGRLAIRQLREGAAVVGLVYLPADVEIVEGAAYLASFRDGQLRIFRRAVDQGLPEECGDMGVCGVSDMLRAPIWYATPNELFTTARFIEAFPDANAWLLVSASNKPLLPEAGDDTGHAWFDFGAAGELCPITAPFDARGAAMGQLVSQHPVWPGPDGQAYVLAQNDSRWRPHFLRHAQLLARLGRGEIDRDAYIATVRADAWFPRIAYGAPDPEYARYLAALEAAGGLRECRPSNAAEYAEDDRRVRRIVADMLHLEAA